MNDRLGDRILVPVLLLLLGTVHHVLIYEYTQRYKDMEIYIFMFL